MSLSESFKIRTKTRALSLKIYKGHFATAHSHMNYYIDIASNKSSIVEARAIADALAAHYKSAVPVDTILCLDGTEVIGAFLARFLSSNDRFNVNAGQEIFVLPPEHTADNQLFFRDNTSPMIRGKRVLVLAASVVTGGTVLSAAEAVQYYGGTTVGIASIFAMIDRCGGVPVCSVFDPHDLPGYVSAAAPDCPMCTKGEHIDGLVNSFGISML